MSIGLMGLGMAGGLVGAATSLVLGQPPWMALLFYAAAGAVTILGMAVAIVASGRPRSGARVKAPPSMRQAPDRPAPPDDQAGRASRARPAIALKASGS